MLGIPMNEWNWEVSNFSSTNYTVAAFGTAVTPAASPSKGSYTALLNNIANDAFGIYICVGASGTAGAIYGGQIDIAIDAANGTSWTLVIPDLTYMHTSIVFGGSWWYFPLFIPRGSAIAARALANTGTTAIRVGVKLVGQPTRPELVRTGSYVETFNASTSGWGTTVVAASATPGAWGSYTASLGTTVKPLWWWQVSCTFNDSALVKYISHWLEVWGGASSSDKKLMECAWNTTDTELLANCAPTMGFANRWLPGGSFLYARAMSTGAVESLQYPIIHGMG